MSQEHVEKRGEEKDQTAVEIRPLSSLPTPVIELLSESWSPIASPRLSPVSMFSEWTSPPPSPPPTAAVSFFEHLDERQQTEPLLWSLCQSRLPNFDNSGRPGTVQLQGALTRLKRSLSEGHVTCVTQRDQDSHSLPTKSVSCVDFTELRLVHEGNSHQPIFSRSWQFSKSFSSKGGRLQGVDSDVILFVPGDAVDDAGDDVTRGCGTIPTQRKRHQSISNNQKEQATPEEDQMNNSEESDSTTAVTIRGATSIDLKGVRGKLKLSATESICSPVVEYYAGENVVFKKPVCISLPHFLPPDADKSNVKVYQVSRSSDGEICVELLKLADTQNHDEGLEEGEKGFTENTASSLGSFYLSEEKRITIFTNHFTGYFCTHCQHGTDPPYLKFRLYGRHLQRRTRDVDLTLFIWDLRLDIRDFRKAGLPDPNDELTLVTSATLEAMTADMISDVRVAVRIHLPLETSGEEAIWRHKQRPNGSPRLQPKRSFDPRMFYPCLCHTEPERAVWSIQCREDHVPPWWFESYIDVGYIHRGDQSFNFLQAPEPQTLQVCLKLMNEVKSASAQTEADLGENTHAKQLSETTTSSTRPVHSDEAMQTSCSFPLEQTGAFQAIPRNASNSDASNYHGSCTRSHNSCTPSHNSCTRSHNSCTRSHNSCTPSHNSCTPSHNSCTPSHNSCTLSHNSCTPSHNSCTRSHNSCTHSQAATPSSEMAALPLNPEDSAANPSTGHQVARSGGEGDNSTKQVIYKDCVFNMQANKSTTNNNVGKLHDMNFGNTTNIASEGDQGVGTPQHHMMKLDLPPVEEVVQQSLAHNSHIENGTDRSLE
ncbi:uncharacterized protein [Littorina saxatilis]|uniref:uncharacterized protein n=1 Tax=Littorina saxatilis TaxID=31220 RepID=UPI0038B518CB